MHPQLPERERPRPADPPQPEVDEIAQALQAELASSAEAGGTLELRPEDLHAVTEDTQPGLLETPRTRNDESPLAHSLLDPGKLPPQTRPPDGERYQLEGSLGRGGMGHVYAARDDLLGRRVALKRVVPPAGAEGSAFEARLLEEARALAAIQHPHVVQVYDLGKDAQGHYLVMELLEGGSLQDKLTTGRLGELEALELGIQMCDALEAIHSRGVVHRDIKPANILFDADGLPKLGDFGLARSAQGAGLTLAGSALGTLAYMAPEQAHDAAAVDARADVYGLGATLYHAVTGESPRMMRESKLPPRLRSVLLKALEEDPRQRFADAAALRAALQALRGPTETQPVANRTRPRPPPDAQQESLYLIDGLLAEARPGEALWLCLVWGELYPAWRPALGARIQRARAAALPQRGACVDCQQVGPANLMLDGCCEDCQLIEARKLAERLRDPAACLAEIRHVGERDGVAAAFLEGTLAIQLQPALAKHLQPELAALRAEAHAYTVPCGQCGQRTGSNLINTIQGRACCPDCTQGQVLAGRVVHRSQRKPLQQSGVESLFEALLTVVIALFMAPLMLLAKLFGSTRKHVLEDEDAEA